MLYIIILAIFIIPIASIVTIHGTIVWYPQLLALQFMGGVCFASRFWKLNKFLALFLAYLVFSYIFITGASPRTLLCLMIGLIAISITGVAAKIKNLKWVYASLITMSLISIAYTLLQAFGKDPIFISTEDRYGGIVSFMGSHNQLGIYSAANAFWNPWLISLAVIPIFLAKCNSAMIGLYFGSMVYGYFRFGLTKLLVFMAICFILIIPWYHFCNKGTTEIKERLKLWKLTVTQLVHGKIESYDLQGNRRVIRTSPWLGFGLGNFFSFSPLSQYKIWGLDKTHMKADGPVYEKHLYEHAHNDLVEAFCEFGYVGFAILVGAILSVVFVFASSVKSLGVITAFSSLVAQSVASFSVYVFHAPVSLFMFCLTLGIFYKEVEDAKQSQVKQVTTQAT